MSITGPILESNYLKFSFKIEKFNQFNETLFYENFYFAQGLWNIKIYPKQYDDFVGIFLQKKMAGSANVNFQITIINFGGKVIESHETNKNFEDELIWGWAEFIPRSDLLKAISPNFCFTVVCKMVLISRSPDFMFTDQLIKICCKNFHDIQIQVQDQVIPAHRIIISTFSSVLYKKFCSSDKSDVLKIKNFSFETIQEVINYMYARSVHKTDNNVKEILLAAKKYEIKSLQAECENYISERMTVENAFENLIFADQHSIGSLCMRALCIIDKDIDVFLKDQNYWQSFVLEHPTAFRRIFQKVVGSLLSENLDGEDDDELYLEFKSEISATSNDKSNISGDDVTDDLEKLFETMELADVVFEIDKKRLSAHKCLLISRSTVFKAMFTHDTLESKENRIKIVDFNYDTMKHLLMYIYCGRVSGLEENAVSLFSAADKYNLMKLKDLCRISMKQNVTVDNFTEILKLTDLHPTYLSELKEIAIQFFVKKFDKIFKTPAWKSFANANSSILNEILMKLLKSKK